MIIRLSFHTLKKDLDPLILEEMLRATRSMLLRIPEVLAVRSGRNLDDQESWPFYYSIECGSTSKLQMIEDDPIFQKMVNTIIKPNVGPQKKILTYELDPSKDLKYS